MIWLDYLYVHCTYILVVHKHYTILTRDIYNANYYGGGEGAVCAPPPNTSLFIFRGIWGSGLDCLESRRGTEAFAFGYSYLPSQNSSASRWTSWPSSWVKGAWPWRRRWDCTPRALALWQLLHALQRSV